MQEWGVGTFLYGSGLSEAVDSEAAYAEVGELWDSRDLRSGPSGNDFTVAGVSA